MTLRNFLPKLTRLTITRYSINEMIHRKNYIMSNYIRLSLEFLYLLSSLQNAASTYLSFIFLYCVFFLILLCKLRKVINKALETNYFGRRNLLIHTFPFRFNKHKDFVIFLFNTDLNLFLYYIQGDSYGIDRDRETLGKSRL